MTSKRARKNTGDLGLGPNTKLLYAFENHISLLLTQVF